LRIAFPCISFFGPFLLFSLLGGSLVFLLGFLPHGLLGMDLRKWVSTNLNSKFSNFQT